MKIQIGEVYMDKITNQKTMYPNKTKTYLLPCLIEYGTEFMGKINNVFKVAAGLGDVIISNRKIVYEKHVFILLDSRIANKFFISFLDWIKDQPMYQDDYVYDNIQKSHYHMVILKFPQKYYETFHVFKEGKYSQMFGKENLPKFFENYPNIKSVLIKDRNYRVEFTERLNKKFKLDGKHKVKPSEWEGELDFPPTEKTEVFNHHIKH